MKIAIKEYKGNKQIYMIALILYIFADVFLGKSQIGYQIPATILVIIYWLVDALLILKLFSSFAVHGRMGNLKMLGILALVVVTGTITHDHSYICMLLLICSAYDIPFEEIIKVMAVAIIISTTIVLCLYEVGLIDESISYRDGAMRHSIGFKYIGSLDDLFRHSMIIILYLSSKKREKQGHRKSLILPLFFASGAYFIYTMSLSRTNMYISEAFCVFYMLFCYRRKQRKRRSKLMLRIKEFLAFLFIPGCAVFSCILPRYLYESKILSDINKLLTGRLIFANTALLSYDFKLLGQNVIWVGSEAVATGLYTMADYNYVDNGYIQVGLQYGIIVLAVIGVAYSYLFFSMVKEGNTFICIWILLMGIENMIIPTLIRFSSNAMTLYAVQFYIMKGHKRSGGRLAVQSV